MDQIRCTVFVVISLPHLNQQISANTIHDLTFRWGSQLRKILEIYWAIRLTARRLLPKDVFLHLSGKRSIILSITIHSLFLGHGNLNFEAFQYHRPVISSTWITLKRLSVADETILKIVNVTHIKSGWKWCRIAQKPRPFLHEVVILVSFTPRYPDVTLWHHSESI